MTPRGAQALRALCGAAAPVEGGSTPGASPIGAFGAWRGGGWAAPGPSCLDIAAWPCLPPPRPAPAVLLKGEPALGAAAAPLRLSKLGMAGPTITTTDGPKSGARGRGDMPVDAAPAPPQVPPLSL
jgi:hypothetical protein